MLTAVYGGAFDPVHNGHLAVAQAAAEQLQATVRLMPTGDPRHRPPAHVSGAQRVAMLQLAVQGLPALQVDTREVDRDGPSYSVDTVLALRAELGDTAPIALVLGADSFVRLATWHRWRELLDLAHLVVAERPGVRLPATDAHAPADTRNGDAPPELAAAAQHRWTSSVDHLHDTPAGAILRLQLPLRPESSSAIRTRLGAGDSVAGWLPAAVEAYVREHGLYLGAPPAIDTGAG